MVSAIFTSHIKKISNQGISSIFLLTRLSQGEDQSTAGFKIWKLT